MKGLEVKTLYITVGNRLVTLSDARTPDISRRKADWVRNKGEPRHFSLELMIRIK